MPKTDSVFLNIPAALSKLYAAADPKALGAALDRLLAKEREWTETGYSDGFYIYAQIRAIADRAMKEANTEMTSFLLAYRNRHFDPDFAEAAEENETDISFGLKERPQVYYAPGSVLEFGLFSWSDLDGAPDEPVRWQSVLQKEDRALLLAQHGLEVRPYHDALQDTTWETASLRAWLNEDFLDRAFSPDEQERILPVLNRNPDNADFHIKGGNDTKDRIFLLSSEEAETLCADPYFLRKKASPHARKAGAAVDENGYCRWLLRSPGNMWMSAACIGSDGLPDDRGVFVQDTGCCICPALWIRIPDSVRS